MNRKLAFLSSGFAAAIWVAHIREWSRLGVIIPCAAVLGLVVALLLVRKHAKTAICLVLGVLLGFGYNAGYEKWDARVPDGIEQDSHYVQAYVTDYSRTNSKRTGIKCTVEFLSMDFKKLEKPIRATLYYSDMHVGLKPGDKITAQVDINPPENTADFDADTYYKSRKIDVSAMVKGEVRIVRAEKIPLRYFHKAIADKIHDNMRRIFPEKEAAFMSALVIGDKEELSKAIQESMRITGLTHTIAVSGMHISFLVGFIMLIFGKRRAAFIAIPVTLLFTLIAGGSPSVVRAFIMQVFVLVAPLVMRESDVLTSLFAALMIILIGNPHAIGDVGLQLSFAATLGMILFGGVLTQMLMKKNKAKSWTIRGKLEKGFAAGVAMTLSASAFTVPIIAYYFKSLSLISVLANVLLVWAINLLFFIGICITVLGLIHLPLARTFSFIGVWLFGIIEKAVDVMSDIPYASVYADSLSVVIAIGVVYAGGAAAVWLYKKKKKAYKAVAAAAMVLHAVIAIVPAMSAQSRGLAFTVFDVGQGMCTMAEYDGARVVVDCGGDAIINAGDVVYSSLLAENTRVLDALILTHPHADHINGAETLISKGMVKRLYIPSRSSGADEMKRVIEAAHDCATLVYAVDGDMSVDINGLRADIYYSSWSEDENEIGLAVVLTKGDFDFVITGDLGEESEMHLADRVSLPDAEIYLAGHHGSNGSSSNYFLKNIKPDYAVISAGKDNAYGHPDFRTLERFRLNHVRVLRTDESGTIRFTVEPNTGEITDVKEFGRDDNG